MTLLDGEAGWGPSKVPWLGSLLLPRDAAHLRAIDLARTDLAKQHPPLISVASKWHELSSSYGAPFERMGRTELDYQYNNHRGGWCSCTPPSQEDQVLTETRSAEACGSSKGDDDPTCLLLGPE